MRCANTFQNYAYIIRSPKRVCVYALLCCIALSACSSAPASRYSIKQDTAPSFEYGDIEYDQVSIEYEPYNKWTSRPYYVLGKNYVPMQSAKGFTENGQASWYGEKFHGHKTANGEVFDMFALTAAHKTLPLPSIVKVTNNNNGKTIIVRVNDRGPFHGDRILDLSYGAAKKLGYHKQGVANISLEVVHIEKNGDITIGKNDTIFKYSNKQLVAKVVPKVHAPLNAKASSQTIPTKSQNRSGLYVQVMAMENGEKARSIGAGLSNLLQVPTSIPKIKNIYKLQLGPLANEQKAEKVIKELKKIGFEQAFAVHIAQ